MAALRGRPCRSLTGRALCLPRGGRQGARIPQARREARTRLITDQRPTEQHAVRAWVVDDFPAAFQDWHCRITALELPRTFWEKATILHAEYHRPPDLAIRDRFARHYADFAALWAHAGREDALQRLDLLRDVVQHKGRYFASGWANYASAQPGSFRLVPPPHRTAALAQDYAKMEPMFLTPPPAFDAVLAQLAEAERVLNEGVSA